MEITNTWLVQNRKDGSDHILADVCNQYCHYYSLYLAKPSHFAEHKKSGKGDAY